MRRLICVLVLALAFPAAALAQSDPFTPPQVQVPQPTPQVVTPTPGPNQNTGVAAEEPSRGLLFGVAGVVVLLIAGIAFYITRDARRNLTDADKRAIEREGQGPTRMNPQERKQLHRAKEKQRQRDKRQRQARKAQRRR